MCVAKARRGRPPCKFPQDATPPGAPECLRQLRVGQQALERRREFGGILAADQIARLPVRDCLRDSAGASAYRGHAGRGGLEEYDAEAFEVAPLDAIREGEDVRAREIAGQRGFGDLTLEADVRPQA